MKLNESRINKVSDLNGENQPNNRDSKLAEEKCTRSKQNSRLYLSIWTYFGSKNNNSALKHSISTLIQDNEYARLSDNCVPKARKNNQNPNHLRQKARLMFKRRTAILDWLISFSRDLMLKSETVYCALYLLDSYIAKHDDLELGQDELYSVVGACFFIAVKVYELSVIKIKDLADLFKSPDLANRICEIEGLVFSSMLDLPLITYNSIQLLWLISAYINLKEKDLKLCMYLHEAACYSVDLISDQNLLVEGIFYALFEKIRTSKRKRDKVARFFGNSRSELESFVKALSELTQTLHWSNIKSLKHYYFLI